MYFFFNSNTKREILFTIIGLVLLYFYYFFKFIQSGIALEKNFFLSFNYTTAPEYLTQVTNSLYFFFNKYQGSNLLIQLPDFLFYQIFGFEKIWITAILYKTILYLILILNVQKNLKLNNNYNILWIAIVVVSLSSSYGFFVDRLLRNSLTIIFYALIFINLYFLIKKNEISNLNSMILGGSTAILFCSDPWSLLFLVPLYLINFKKLLKRLHYLGFFFSLFMLPALYVFIGQQIHGYNNADYLGAKIIFDKKSFYIDWLFDLAKNKVIIVLLIFNFLINLYNKSNSRTLFLIFSLVAPPLILILFNFTIQTYHLREGATNFVIFCTYFFLLEFLLKNKFIFMKGKFFLIVIIFFTSLYLYFLILRPNHWVDRTVEIKKSYEQDFKKISLLNKDCIVISTDHYILGYAKLLKFKILPEDSFFRNNDIKDSITEVKFLSFFLKIKDQNILTNFYWKATGALFFNTRSTNSKHVNYSSQDFYSKLNKINTMELWTITVPEKDLNFNNINEYVNLNKLEYIKFSENLKNFIYLENNKTISKSEKCDF